MTTGCNHCHPVGDAVTPSVHGDLPNAHLRFYRYDPTRTTTLRNAFVRAMRRRFRKLKKAIQQVILEDDILGLREQQQETIPRAAVRVHAGFDFPRSQARVQDFLAWLQQQINNDILEIIELPRFGSSEDSAWTDIYIKDTYKRGVQRARDEMRKAGYDVPSLDQTGGLDASFSTPFHADRLGLLYTRTFSGLKGITDAMQNQIAQVLTQGMADGDNPRLLAEKLLATISGGGADLGIIDTLGRYIAAEVRAATLARTEIIRAHHQAMMREYMNWHLAGVQVKAEWVTAGYNVCPDCAALEGKVFTVPQIENMIPLHPNCRCVAIPVDMTDEEE